MNCGPASFSFYLARKERQQMDYYFWRRKGWAVDSLRIGGIFGEFVASMQHIKGVSDQQPIPDTAEEKILSEVWPVLQ